MYAKHALYGLLVACIPAYAQQVPVTPATPVPTVAPAPVMAATKPSREAAEIAAINERLAVMTARLAELEMEAKIATKRSEIIKSNALPSMVDETFIPSVLEISGIDGKIWAVLNVHGGNTQTVRVGDRVGAWRVTAINSDSVTVKNKSEVLRLAFGISAPQPQSASMSGGLPPFPAR